MRRDSLYYLTIMALGMRKRFTLTLLDENRFRHIVTVECSQTMMVELQLLLEGVGCFVESCTVAGPPKLK